MVCLGRHTRGLKLYENLLMPQYAIAIDERGDYAYHVWGMHTSGYINTVRAIEVLQKFWGFPCRR